MSQQLPLFANTRQADPYRITPDLRSSFEKAKIIGFDIETTNDLGRIGDDFVRTFFNKKKKYGVSFLTQMVYLGLWCDNHPHGIVLDESQIRDKDTMDWVRSLFARDDIMFVAHNIVFDLRLLAGKYAVPIPKRIWDTFSNEIIFGDGDPAESFLGLKEYNLLALTRQYSVMQKTPYKNVLRDAVIQAVEWNPELKHSASVKLALEGDDDALEEAYFAVHTKLKTFRASIEELPVSIACAYTALDCMATVLIMKEQLKRMKIMQPEYPEVLKIVDFENRFNRLCASMGAQGIPINKRYLLEKIEEWNAEMQDSANKMHKFCIEQIVEKALGELPDNYMEMVYNETKEVAKSVVDVGENIIEARPNELWDHVIKLGDKYAQALKYLRIHGFSPTKTYDKEIYFFYACDVMLPKKDASNTFLWTPTGKPAFNKNSMKWLLERYGDVLKEFRRYQINENKIEKATELLIHAHGDGKVHSSITTRAVTSRTSSSDPNLQNIRMREEWGKDQEGHEILLDPYFTGVLTSEPGKILLGIDVSNGETYVGSMMAKDSDQMTALYSEDYHGQMTRKYFPTLAEAAWQLKETGNDGMWKSLRAASKEVTFGTAYGMGAAKLARNPLMHEAVKPREGEIEALQSNQTALMFLIKREILPEDVLYSPKMATANEWEFACKVWNAQQILYEKDRAFPQTTLAKEQATKYAERHNYVEAWTGRRLYIREARNGWNALCQGGLAELTKRWAVLVHEFLEENAWLDAHVINYIHDEIVIHCPIEFAEYVSKFSVWAMNQVIETSPYDKSGVHWLDRTTPRGGFFVGVDHKDNSHKWGKLVYTDYPFPSKLKWEETTREELEELQKNLFDPAFRYECFKNRRFYAPEVAGGGMGEKGLGLHEYIEYLEYEARTANSWEAKQELRALEVQALSFQQALKLPEEGLIAVLMEVGS